jgi:hypothetical protein
VYVTTNTGDRYCGQVGVGVTEANGDPINQYWQTPLLSGGNGQRFKDWIWSYVTFRTSGGGQVRFDLIEGPTPQVDQGYSASYTIQVPPDGGSPFILDSSLLDGDDVLEGDPDDDLVRFRLRFRLGVLTTGDMARLIPLQTFKASDVQFTIGQSEVERHFEILSVRLQFIWRGYSHVGEV